MATATVEIASIAMNQATLQKTVTNLKKKKGIEAVMVTERNLT